MRVRLVPLCAVVLAASVMLAGCANTIAGTAAAPPSGGSGPLGDPHTLDPCSLVNLNDLSQYGSNSKPQLGISYENCVFYNYSNVSVDSTQLDIFFDLLTGQKQRDQVQARTKLLSGVNYTTATSAGPNDCHANIFLPDGQTIRYQASDPENHNRGDTMCPLVDAAVQSGVKILQSGQARHRIYPDNVWGNASYCSLLNQSDLAVVPGLNASVKVDYPGGHNCYWGITLDQFTSGPIPTSVNLQLSLVTTRDKIADSDQKYIQAIDGKKALIKPFPESKTASGVRVPPSCQVTLWGQEIQKENGSSGNQLGLSSLTETTDLSVYADLSGDQLCNAAKTLATRALTQLPR